MNINATPVATGIAFFEVEHTDGTFELVITNSYAEANAWAAEAVKPVPLDEAAITIDGVGFQELGQEAAVLQTLTGNNWPYNTWPHVCNDEVKEPRMVLALNTSTVDHRLAAIQRVVERSNIPEADTPRVIKTLLAII